MRTRSVWSAQPGARCCPPFGKPLRPPRYSGAGFGRFPCGYCSRDASEMNGSPARQRAGFAAAVAGAAVVAGESKKLKHATNPRGLTLGKLIFMARELIPVVSKSACCRRKINSQAKKMSRFGLPGMGTRLGKNDATTEEIICMLNALASNTTAQWNLQFDY